MSFNTQRAGQVASGAAGLASAVGGAGAAGGAAAGLGALVPVAGALMAGAQILGGLFGGDDAQFQAEVQRQEAEKARTAAASRQSQQQITQSFGQGAAVEGQIQQGTVEALSRFLP